MAPSKLLRTRSKRALFLAGFVVLFVAAEGVSKGIGQTDTPRSEPRVAEPAPVVVAMQAILPPRPATALPADFDPRTARLVDSKYVAELAGGSRAELTLDPGLTRHVSRELERYAVPFGALVAMDPRDGRILALVSHSSASPGANVAFDASPPAASVFKIVTAAALLDRGVLATDSLCYGGGLHGIGLPDLADDAARDTRCATLSDALSGSINSVFAKLADRRLEHGVLARYASAFGFGQPLPLEISAPTSGVEVPDDRLEFARMAAGFWHTHLSPMHGALVASTVANGGVMPRAILADRIVGPDGTVLATATPGAHRTVVGPEAARVLTAMMERTVSSGTAHSAFFDDHGVAFLPGIRVAGKTGTLTAERPEYRGYTWFVGFAPADAPTIAVAALVVNTPEWRIKASYLAREALRYRLVVSAPRVAATAPAR